MHYFYALLTGILLAPAALLAQEDLPDVDSYDALENDIEFEKDTTLNYLDADSAWWSSVQLGINFNQSSFSGNWTGGGVTSFSFANFFNYELHYLYERISWDNQVEGLFGMIRNADQTFIRKSQDRIFLDTKIGYSLSENWNLFVGSNFLSQFAPGYRYEEDAITGADVRFLISDFMAPAFLTTSVGVEYRPNEHFWLRLSPFAPRLTFVTNTNLMTENGKNYGVPPGETIRKEWLALQVTTEYQRKLTDDIDLQVRYLLFSNYDALTFETIDHRLDVLLNAKLTRFINFSAGLIGLYDLDQDDDVQISQSMGIGILLQN